MRVPHWNSRLAGVAVVAGVLCTTVVPIAAQRNRVPPAGVARPSAPARTAVVRHAYELGYQEGVTRGERDGRERREFDYERNDWYRSADRGYERSYGNRDAYRTEYRRGFATGYRTGYTRYRVVNRNGRRGGGYREPAAARGYSDGYEKGFDDGDDEDRYDPVQHSAYRKGDAGYNGDYGSKDAYRNNYRVGFREGYEDGYRQGTRG